MKVLYIEDDPADIDITLRWFQKNAKDIELSIARSQREAVKIIKGPDFLNFDLILTDMHLGDGDGIAILSHIRNLSIQMPVVILTGQGDEESAVAAFKAGADNYVVKKSGYLKNLPHFLEETYISSQHHRGRRIQKLNVLYVEHNQPDVDLTIRHFKKHAPHINISTISHGAEFLTLLRRPNGLSNYDVLLLDYRLPQENALEILKQIKESVFSKIPVILITGKGDEEIAARALRIGAFDYVIKNLGYLYKLPSSIENAYSSMRLEREHEALLASEQRYRSLFENRHTIMLLVDPENEEVVDANPAAVRFYGWSKEEFRGKSVAELNTLPLAEIRKKLRAAVNGERNHFIFEHYRADGSSRDVEVYSGPIEVGGKSLLYSIVYDITERSQAEKEKEKLQLQLIQAQKMESVGRLAGGVAHDYNNMLSVIIGYATGAIEQLNPNSTLYNDISMILKAANRSVDITRQLLAFARQQTITPKVLDLNNTVASMLKMLQRLIGEDIHLSWEPGDELWSVKIDPGQVDQVLANLCVNARDAIQNVGRVTIQTKSVILDQSYCMKRRGFTPGEYAMLAVSDSGCGMDQEVLANAFDPFFTTKEIGHGTGLGLSTVYGIVKQNNGLIDIESDPGAGTIIRIYLPKYGKEAVAASLAVSLNAPAGAGEVVLVVEDEPLLLKLTKKMLAKLGYKAVAVETPTEALRMAESHMEEIVLLLTDVVMPEMNGRQLAEKMKHFCPNLKVLYMSGYTADVIAHHGVLEDGVCFIPKPFSQSELAVELKKAIKNTTA